MGCGSSTTAEVDRSNNGALSDALFARSGKGSSKRRRRASRNAQQHQQQPQRGAAENPLSGVPASSSSVSVSSSAQRPPGRVAGGAAMSAGAVVTNHPSDSLDAMFSLLPALQSYDENARRNSVSVNSSSATNIGGGDVRSWMMPDSSSSGDTNTTAITSTRRASRRGERRDGPLSTSRGGDTTTTTVDGGSAASGDPGMMDEFEEGAVRNERGASLASADVVLADINGDATFPHRAPSMTWSIGGGPATCNGSIASSAGGATDSGEDAPLAAWPAGASSGNRKASRARTVRQAASQNSPSAPLSLSLSVAAASAGGNGGIQSNQVSPLITESDAGDVELRSPPDADLLPSPAVIHGARRPPLSPSANRERGNNLSPRASGGALGAGDRVAVLNQLNLALATGAQWRNDEAPPHDTTHGSTSHYHHHHHNRHPPAASPGSSVEGSVVPLLSSRRSSSTDGVRPLSRSGGGAAVAT